MIALPHASKSFKEKNPQLFQSLGDSGGKVRPQTNVASEDSTPLQTKSDAKSEKELQGQIVNLLRLKGIEVLWHRCDKRSAATVGWPDLSFAVTGFVWIPAQMTVEDEGYSSAIVYACAWEVKLPGRKLSPEQEALRPKLEANGWRYRVITSVDQALGELKAMGIE